MDADEMLTASIEITKARADLEGSLFWYNEGSGRLENVTVDTARAVVALLRWVEVQ